MNVTVYNKDSNSLRISKDLNIEVIDRLEIIKPDGSGEELNPSIPENYLDGLVDKVFNAGIEGLTNLPKSVSLYEGDKISIAKLYDLTTWTWDIEDKSVVAFDIDKKEVNGLKPGKTNVVIKGVLLKVIPINYKLSVEVLANNSLKGGTADGTTSTTTLLVTPKAIRVKKGESVPIIVNSNDQNWGYISQDQTVALFDRNSNTVQGISVGKTGIRFGAALKDSNPVFVTLPVEVVEPDTDMSKPIIRKFYNVYANDLILLDSIPDNVENQKNIKILLDKIALHRTNYRDISNIKLESYQEDDLVYKIDLVVEPYNVEKIVETYSFTKDVTSSTIIKNRKIKEVEIYSYRSNGVIKLSNVEAFNVSYDETWSGVNLYINGMLIITNAVMDGKFLSVVSDLKQFLNKEIFKTEEYLEHIEISTKLNLEIQNNNSSGIQTIKLIAKDTGDNILHQFTREWKLQYK